LAKASGVSPSAFRKWLKGVAEPSRDRLVALAGASGVTVSWLAHGEGAAPDLADLALRARASGQMAREGTLPLSQFLVLPRQLETAAAGAGAPAPGPLDFIPFQHDWLRTALGRAPADIILVIAVGDSMEPQIRDGDLLLVDTIDHSFQSFGIYVIEARGERLVKRVQRKFDGSLILISDNAAYQPESISSELAKEIHAIGRVIWRGGQI
jgi:phage repressor protein C with HTH and peptisase S24 domain